MNRRMRQSLCAASVLLAAAFSAPRFLPAWRSVNLTERMVSGPILHSRGWSIGVGRNSVYLLQYRVWRRFTDEYQDELREVTERAARRRFHLWTERWTPGDDFIYVFELPTRANGRFGQFRLDRGWNHHPPDFESEASELRAPWWFIPSCFCLPPAASLVRTLAHKRRQRARRLAGRCVDCGYDLRATSAACPECGRSRGTAADPAQTSP